MEMMNIDDDSVCEDSGNETSGDDVDFNVEVESGLNKETQSFEDEYQYEVLSTSDIVQYMSDIIDEVNSVAQLPPTTARILLNYFNWDKEKLMERFFDGDQEELFREANVINPFKSVPVAAKPAKLPQKIRGTEVCNICYMVFAPMHMTGLECGHRFCYQCWNEYLTTKIVEEGVGQTIACAAHDCPILVDDETVMRLVRDSRVKIKYQHLITNSFIECNRLLRWCPSPDCNYAIKVNTRFVKLQTERHTRPMRGPASARVRDWSSRRTGFGARFEHDLVVAGGVRGLEAGGLLLRSRVLLRLRRELARPRQVQPAEEVDQEVRRRLRDVELDLGQHEGVPQVRGHHREGRRVQPHGVQESELQGRFLLGVPGLVGAPRQLLVQLQQVRRRRSEGGQGRAREIACGPPTLSILL
jgi:hypothetical protein